MNQVEKSIKYCFKNCDLIKTALTHSSYIECANGEPNNERLEYFGDAVLELCMSEYIFNRFKDMDEGSMTKMRAQAVCQSALVRVAQKHDIGAYMRMGKGEEQTGGRGRPSILADAVEAIIGALYIDGGLEAAKAFVLSFAKDAIDRAQKGGAYDYKSKFQEKLQQKGSINIEYSVLSQVGPEHNKVFESIVTVEGVIMGKGFGNSKKESEQAAAKCALESF